MGHPAHQQMDIAADLQSMIRGRFIVLTAAAAFAAAALAAFPASSAPGVRAARIGSLEQGVLAQINVFRRSHGLAALRISTALNRAASQHSQEMARDGYFAHESADGSSFDKRVGRFYPSSRRTFWSVGENLVWASPDLDASGAMQLWLNSPPHRENLLTARWREIGISAVHVAAAPGAYGGQPVTIVTADFGVRR
jgi:uncharacterized protein YkwD